MSKAFVKESDHEEDDIDEGPRIPVGVKNYITPTGLKKLQDELSYLKGTLRPEITRTVTWAAENGDRSENADYKYGKKKLREIDKRIRFLAKRLDSIEVIDPVDPARKNADQIFFGATVTIQFDDEEKARVFSIVGIDEMDADKGKISWISPLANALLKARVGDFVTLKSPKGPRDIEILDIRYVAIP